MIVHFENHLDNEDTAIHWHGIELPNKSDGTPLTQNMVPPGGSYLYNFVVTRPGVYWYHPHHQYSTNQVSGACTGRSSSTTRTRPRSKRTGPSRRRPTRRPIVLSDLTICKAPGRNDTTNYTRRCRGWAAVRCRPRLHRCPKDLCEKAPAGKAIDEDGNPASTDYPAGDIPAIQNSWPPGGTNEGQTVLTNGKNVGGRAGAPAAPGALAPARPPSTSARDRGCDSQIVNAPTVRYMRLRLTTGDGAFVPLVRVGGEGGLLDNAVARGRHAPGLRHEVRPR